MIDGSLSYFRYYCGRDGDIFNSWSKKSLDNLSVLELRIKGCRAILKGLDFGGNRTKVFLKIRQGNFDGTEYAIASLNNF